MICRRRRMAGKLQPIESRETPYANVLLKLFSLFAAQIFRYGWVIVFASFMCNMIVDGIAYTFGVFIDEFVNDFKVGKGTVAWVGSCLSGVYLLAGNLFLFKIN